MIREWEEVWFGNALTLRIVSMPEPVYRVIARNPQTGFRLDSHLAACRNEAITTFSNLRQLMNAHNIRNVDIDVEFCADGSQVPSGIFERRTVRISNVSDISDVLNCTGVTGVFGVTAACHTSLDAARTLESEARSACGRQQTECGLADDWEAIFFTSLAVTLATAIVFGLSLLFFPAASTALGVALGLMAAFTAAAGAEWQAHERNCSEARESVGRTGDALSVAISRLGIVCCPSWIPLEYREHRPICQRDT
jgi:hypothetical protein